MFHKKNECSNDNVKIMWRCERSLVVMNLQRIIILSSWRDVCGWSHLISRTVMISQMNEKIRDEILKPKNIKYIFFPFGFRFFKGEHRTSDSQSRRAAAETKTWNLISVRLWFNQQYKTQKYLVLFEAGICGNFGCFTWQIFSVSWELQQLVD